MQRKYIATRFFMRGLYDESPDGNAHERADRVIIFADNMTHAQQITETMFGTDPETDWNEQWEAYLTPLVTALYPKNCNIDNLHTMLQVNLSNSEI